MQIIDAVCNGCVMVYNKLFIGKLFHRLIQPRRRPVGHDADGGSVLILLGAVTILIKLL